MINLNEIPNNSTVSVVVKINMAISTMAKFIVDGKCGHIMASKIRPEIDAIHMSNLPMLDSDVSADPRDLDYLVLRNVDSNETIVLATVWLNSVTVKNVASYRLNLDNISTDEYDGLVKILNNYGLAGRWQLIERA